MRQKLRPAATAAPELVEENELLERIQKLYDALANDEYAEYEAGYDPDYSEYRGFGDDSWIDEMDSLFAAATALYRAENYRDAAIVYITCSISSALTKTATTSRTPTRPTHSRPTST
jgi:hypothetical protein